MWFGDVDVPRELVAAHQAGELVLFVGAGASVDAPSNLPTFGRLAHEIAAHAGTGLSPQDGQRPDRFLANLVDRRVGVHDLVHERISTSTRSNRTHRAVARLAASSATIRVVTTNYDLHLSRQLRRHAGTVPTYRAPALPRGDDFEGLVYLHGNVDQRPQDLTITERDFGAAYLTDAWATRFLERMFDRFAVLFIGYSHADVVMGYLARALRDPSKRFVLTSEADRLEWRSYDLKVVQYQKIDGSHRQAVESLERWTERSQLNLLAHRQEAKRLLGGQPPLPPEDESYLEAAVEDDTQLKFFCEFAQDLAWLPWIARQPRFNALFDPAAEIGDGTRPLAWWFAETALRDEASSNAALRVVEEQGGRLSPVLWDTLSRNLSRASSPFPHWWTRWLAVLLDHAPRHAMHTLEFLLGDLRLPADRVAALRLLDHLVAPSVTMRTAYGTPASPPWFEVKLCGDKDLLEHEYAKVFGPHVADVSTDLLLIADTHLRSTFRLLNLTGSSALTDPLSYSRAAIAQDKHNGRYGDFDVLIDMARDALEAEVSNASPLGIGILDQWEQSGIPLLRRLAVHGWIHRADVTASGKIDAIHQRGWLDDLEGIPEVYALVAAVIGDASAASITRLARQVSASTGEADTSTAHWDLNMLSLLADHRPDVAAVRTARNRMASQHPDFTPATQPDRRRNFRMGFVAPNPPMSEDELRARIADDARSAVSELRTYESATSVLATPNWESTLGLVTNVVREDPTCGFTLIDLIEDEQPQLVAAIIHGWTRAKVDDDTAERILQRLLQLDPHPVSYELTYLIAHSDSGPDATEWHRYPSARTLAAQLWDTIQAPEGDDGAASDVRWLDRAINHDAGRIARFWIIAVEHEWRTTGDPWQGLDRHTREQLERILVTDSADGELARIVLVSHMLFLFDADPPWCSEHLLPLLYWDDPQRALRMWDGYLYSRWNDPLLAAGLLDAFRDAVDHLDAMPERVRDAYLAHVAGIALTSEHDPTNLVSKLARVGLPEHNSEWMRQVAWLMRDLPANAVQHAWQRWIRDYWTMRVRGAPRMLTEDESSAIAGWSAYLVESFPETVDLATMTTARLDTPSTLVDDLNDKTVDRWPAETVRLLAHLLERTEGQIYDCDRLKRITANLRNRPRPPDMTVIVDHALRLGCSDAHDW